MWWTIFTLFVIAGANRQEDITRDLFLGGRQDYVRPSVRAFPVSARLVTRESDFGSGDEVDSCDYTLGNVLLFSSIASALDELANDCTVSPDTLYRYSVTSTNVDFNMTSQSSLLFADLFSEDESVSLNVTVECGSSDCAQSSFQLFVNLTIATYESRLLPHGSELSDERLSDVDDDHVTVILDSGIFDVPIFSNKHRKFYVSNQSMKHEA